MNNTTIIFDLDGTLVDTAPDLTNTLNHLLQHRGFAPIEAEIIRTMIGRGARKMIERGFRVYNQSFDADTLDGLVAKFLEHYSQNLSVYSKVFPGVLAQLEALKASGAILAVCTNKSEKLATAVLNDLSMDQYFKAILGSDSLPMRKPDPRHLTGTIERAGGDPARAIMIGDSATDILTAKAANIPVIAVTFGYSEPGFDGTKPDATIDHYDELTSAIARFLR